MKIFSKLLLLCMLSCIVVQAQEMDVNEIQTQTVSNYYKWQLGVSLFATDHTSVRGVGDGFFDTEDFSTVPYPAKLTLVRGLNRSFDVDGTVNLGQIDNKRLDVENEFMVNATLGLRYRFANGYILNPTSWFDPYLRLGTGLHHLDYQSLQFDNIVDQQGHTIDNKKYAEIDHFTITGGLGINCWIGEKWGVNVMSAYYHIPGQESDNIDFFQHSAGFVFRLGNLDRDGDGIADKEDECPDTPGLLEFNGCPDTDADGLPDHKDGCPTEFGPIENNGCPYNDRDQDTILDDVDECPDVPGLIEYNGCPPPVRVVPDTPEVPDVTPTPEEPKPILFEEVYFEFDRSELKSNAAQKVQEVANQINGSGKAYYVTGHTDTRGSASYNKMLSKRRAQSVADALIKQGVDPSKLQVVGKGEEFPLCTEDTEACHSKNRRVEIKIVK